MTKPLNEVWGAANPIVVRASAALSGGGVWDAAPTEFSVAGIGAITFYITYTRAGAGGAFDLQLRSSPYSADVVGVQSWFAMSLYTSGVLAAGVDTQSRIQAEYITYQATAAGAEVFVYGPVELMGTVERLRVRCRESGAVATPGTVHIVAVAA